jgi:predicted dehydrogenase
VLKNRQHLIVPDGRCAQKNLLQSGVKERNMPKEIGIGLVGTGFARTAQIPAFRACKSARLVAICSGHYENAVKAAKEFEIPHACQEFNQLVELNEVDLVVVSAPPNVHRAAAIAALGAGKHVICEKPMAMNADEAQEMTRFAAERPGQLAVIDHELRFNPTRRRLKEVIESGLLGEIYHVTLTVASGFRHSARRPWNWWADKSAGGGLLGAIGSHAIDQLRWLFGEITGAWGVVETMIPFRVVETTGEKKRVDSDDYSSFLVRIEPGHTSRQIHGTVVLSAVYAAGGRNGMTIAGENGTLILDGDEKLLLAKGYESAFEDLSVDDPARQVPGIADNIWSRSFYHLACATLEALSAGKSSVPGAATFEDGLRCQRVIDAIQRSSAESNWYSTS